ncbi:Uncharacterised protein [Vibrio cholerae]|nr:Uncharacterised protein [Vibrio cholerae]
MPLRPIWPIYTLLLLLMARLGLSILAAVSG